MMSDDDNHSQMIFGDLWGLKLPDICLTDKEKPEKISPRKVVQTGDRTWAHCMTGAHATASPTAVDDFFVCYQSVTKIRTVYKFHKGLGAADRHWQF